MKEVQLISGPLNGEYVKVEDGKIYLDFEAKDGEVYRYSLGVFAAFVRKISDHPFVEKTSNGVSTNTCTRCGKPRGSDDHPFGTR